MNDAELRATIRKIMKRVLDWIATADVQRVREFKSFYTKTMKSLDKASLTDLHSTLDSVR